MNSEHRHELKENLLAKEIDVWSDKLKPYASMVGMGIFVAIALFAAASWWKGSQAATEASGWEAYQMAALAGDGEFKAMQRVAESEDYQGTKMQEWAYMAWADRQLLMASYQYLPLRDIAKDRLTNIRGVYEQLANSAGDAELRNRAQLGLARVFEAQNQFDESRAAYNKVKGPLAELASERAKLLESTDVQQTYTWLATADIPKPQPPSGPGTPGRGPEFGVDTPQGDPDDQKSELDLGDTQTLEQILGGQGAEK